MGAGDLEEFGKGFSVLRMYGASHDKNIGSIRWNEGKTPTVRAFCAALEIPEKPAAKAIADCVRAAYVTAAMIEASGINDQQKRRLLEHFHAHSLAASLAKRDQTRAGAAVEQRSGLGRTGLLVEFRFGNHL